MYGLYSSVCSQDLCLVITSANQDTRATAYHTTERVKSALGARTDPPRQAQSGKSVEEGILRHSPHPPKLAEMFGTTYIKA